MNHFEKIIEVRWADVDQNQHVRHSAYYDYGAQARIRFFMERGFDIEKLKTLMIGPILFHEQCSFIKELTVTENIRVNILNGGVTPDGARWKLHHEIFNTAGKKAAHITVNGAWMDIVQRKLTVPPKELADALLSLPPGEDFIYKKNE